jgi:site-specific DNA-cytosine methylase
MYVAMRERSLLTHSRSHTHTHTHNTHNTHTHPHTQPAERSSTHQGATSKPTAVRNRLPPTAAAPKVAIASRAHVSVQYEEEGILLKLILLEVLDFSNLPTVRTQNYGLYYLHTHTHIHTHTHTCTPHTHTPTHPHTNTHTHTHTHTRNKAECVGERREQGRLE